MNPTHISFNPEDGRLLRNASLTELPANQETNEKKEAKSPLTHTQSRGAILLSLSHLIERPPHPSPGPHLDRQTTGSPAARRSMTAPPSSATSSLPLLSSS